MKLASFECPSTLSLSSWQAGSWIYRVARWFRRRSCSRLPRSVCMQSKCLLSVFLYCNLRRGTADL